MPLSTCPQLLFFLSAFTTFFLRRLAAFIGTTLQSTPPLSARWSVGPLPSILLWRLQAFFVLGAKMMELRPEFMFSRVWVCVCVRMSISAITGFVKEKQGLS